MVHLMKKLPLLAMIVVVGCQPSDPDDDPDVDTDTLPAVTAETHRERVQTAVRDTRERMDERESRLVERSEDVWDRISAQADETWNEIETGLAEIGSDDPESIDQSREDTAHRLAELEAELADAEVETARTPEELRDVSNEWLDQIQSDVSRLDQLLPQAADSLDIDLDLDLDRDGLQDVREQMQEIRADIEESLADTDNFEDRRDDVAEELADLVQQVGETLYQLEWSRSSAAD